jgi:Protein of unknown function (DUF2637)
MTVMGSHAKLSRLAALASDNPALLGVAGIGFAVSFQTIATLARQHGLPGWPPLYPIGIDVGILALITESRKAIDAHRSDLVPRLLAWCLAALTIYVNAHGAAPHDWLGRALHVVMPALWVAFLELTRWRKLARRRADDKRDRIPLAHWLAAPLPTFFMWRRMVLRNITSYALAVELEDARRFARDLARAHYGRQWKRQAPRVLTARIRTGRLGDDVLTAAMTDGTGGWDLAVRAMVLTAVTEGDKLTVSVRRERKRIDSQDERQDDSQKTPQKTPRKAVSETAKKRGRIELLLKAMPALTTADVVARSGASESTVLRVKRELNGSPDRTVVAIGARG